MENLKQKIYDKYEVKDLQGLIQYFEMKTSFPLEDLEINDANIYHSPALILDKVKENDYNPLEEQVLLISTFLNSFYGISFAEFGEVMSAFGSFKTYYLFKNILEENDFYKEFYKLYKNYIERLNNIGIILIKEGKELIGKVDDFISGISPESISELLEEVNEKLLETGILDELNIEKN